MLFNFKQKILCEKRNFWIKSVIRSPPFFRYSVWIKSTMYQIFWNSEPHITTFDESKYFFTFLGSFVAFLCILIFTIFVRKVPYILYLVIPLCFSIFFVYTSSPSVIKYVQNVISILQVPVLIAEAFLFALLTKRITAFL